MNFEGSFLEIYITITIELKSLKSVLNVQHINSKYPIYIYINVETYKIILNEWWFRSLRVMIEKNP